MAFDELLAERITEGLKRVSGIESKRMFGGLGYLWNGHMTLSIWNEKLVVRVGPDDYEDALLESFVQPFDVTGRPLTGWVCVLPEGVETAETLQFWIDRAILFVQSLPPKTGSKPKRRKRQ